MMEATMGNARTWLRRHLPEVFGLFALMGFFLTLAELFLMGHVEGVQVVAPIAATLGALAVGLGLLLPQSRPLAVALLLLVGGAGLVGLLEHLEASLGEAQGTPRVVLVDEEGEAWPGWEGKEQEGTPPPLAPLSLSGLGLLGALALWVREP